MNLLERVGYRRLALLLWGIPLLVIFIRVAAHPTYRSATVVYHQAASEWIAGEPLYTHPLAYNYLPVFAPLFIPFHCLPLPVGDLLWRMLAAGLLASGLWRLIRQLTIDPWPAFLLTTAVALPVSLSSFSNGQANALLAALMLQTVACLQLKQWNWAAVLITLAVVVKPIGLVLLLLVPLVYPQVLWRLIVAIIVLAVLPFGLGVPAYVLAEHRAFLANLQVCSEVTKHRFADINGIIRTFGGELAPDVSRTLRMTAGPVTAGVWWWVGRRVREPQRGLLLYALVAAYLMLFNPMTEANSYVILAPAIGLWAVMASAVPGARPMLIGMVCISATMILLPTLLWAVCGNYFKLFWYPAMTIVFVGLVAGVLWLAERKSDEQEAAEKCLDG